MLNRKTRQIYLRDIGFYKGPINGKWTADTKAAVYALQKKYWPKKYWDGGKYTSSVDILLQNAWNVQEYAPHFTLDEFKCRCKGEYCNGYSVLISVQLLQNLEKLRKKFGKPITPTCGIRCKKYNNSKKGSIPNSLHLSGQAVDLYVKEISDTTEGRKKIMAYWKTLPKYHYTYCYIPGSSVAAYRTCSNMGNAVHVDVSK